MKLSSKAKWLCICLGLALVLINVTAFWLDRQATQYLQVMQTATTSQRALNHQRDLLHRQISAFRTPDMTDALRQAVESAPLPDLLLAPTDRRRWQFESFYLCAPDDSQTLLINIAVTDKPIAMNPATKSVPTKVIELPLKAGKLHEISVGFPTSNDRFRVDFDDREVYFALWPGFRSGASSGFHSEGHFGLIQPSTLQEHYRDYGPVLKSGQWRRVSSKSFTLAKGQQRKQIGFTMALRTSGPLFVSERLYWDAHRMTNLQWDDDLQRYRILSLKEQP